ncbi:MAG: polymer-forming cytoskeletal protein [Desulfocapsa sp.]|nr:MAG: polymer-forming cytoskeletal protein [Desulfocapsa sp.]
MGIFNQNQKDTFEQQSQQADKEVISSIIDANMVMKGELVFAGKARVDGTVEGNIKGEHLILSESGKIVGDIQVKTFVCHGALEGNIKANLVTARKNSSIHGRIESNSLTVEPGAGLDGEMKVTCNDLHLVNEKNATDSSSTKTAEA